MTAGPEKAIKTLLIEDDVDDYLLTTELLSEINDVNYDVVWHAEIPDVEAVFLGNKFDVALVDFQVGKWNGVDLIKEAREIGFKAPLILLTGLQEYEVDIAAADAGAADFLGKGEITPQILERSIRYAINTNESRLALQQQSTVLRSTLDNTDTGFGAFNSAQQLVACNVPFLELLDFYDEAQKIDGFTISDPDALTPFSDRIIERLSAASLSESSQTDLLECASKILEIRRNNTPDGGMVVICDDMTARVMREEIMRDAKKFAEEANRAKSVFLANMSHELRTPLNAIIGFSQIMNKEALGPVGSPQYREYASHIQGAGEHLLALINDVLDISKIEAGEIELRDEKLDLCGLVGSCVAMLRERAAADGISLVTDFSDDTIPLLRADPLRLKQVLLNLMSNSIKFTEPDGTVTIKIRYKPDSGYVMQCTDTGIGIAADDIPKALARFQQINNDLTREHEGTGLGLPLTKALIELHGGSFDLQSQVGCGTTVTIRLPAERRVNQDELSIPA